MKSKTLLAIITCIFALKVNAEVIIHQPQGEYAIIANNIKDSSELLRILRGEVKGNKTEAAAKIENNLSQQIPLAILELGNYYIAQNDFEKAALFHRFAIFRTIIDIRASNDRSLDDALPISYSWIREALSKSSQQDVQIYSKKLRIITKQIIAMDKQIPRNYDIRWASLHSIKAFYQGHLDYAYGEELQKIIEQERESYIEAAKKDNAW